VSPFRPDLVDVWIFRFRRAPSSGRGPAPGQSTAGPIAASTAGPIAAPAAQITAAAALPTPPKLDLEILLMRRSPGRILPGLWQCVSGSLEAGETVTDGALRELVEETGFGPEQVRSFYDLDQVNQFHEPSVRGIVTAAVFAVRVGPTFEPVLSHEHDALRWVSPEGALELAVWPAYRESIRRIVENLIDPERSIWFELTLAGDRARV
jgi:8-oxo-dGTP pyrophosphatase MutT (NUDIX family)